MRTGPFKPSELTRLFAWCLAIVMVIGVTGCQEEDKEDLSHRLTYDPEFSRKHQTQMQLAELENASIVALVTYDVSEKYDGFCEEKLVEIWKGKELAGKLLTFGEGGPLTLQPTNEDGTCPPDGIAFFTVSEGSDHARQTSVSFIHDGIVGKMTVEEVRAAAIRQKQPQATP